MCKPEQGFYDSEPVPNTPWPNLNGKQKQALVREIFRFMEWVKNPANSGENPMLAIWTLVDGYIAEATKGPDQ